MASGDAVAFAVKNVAYRVTFPILDADGDLVTGAGSLDSEVDKDAAGFADCTNEATEIATSSGMYYLDLTSGEMNADTVSIIVKSATGKTTPIVIYTIAAVGLPADVKGWLAAAAPALVGGRLDASVGAMASAVLTATAMAADAIGASEFSQAAADKVWATAARILTASTNFNDPDAAARSEEHTSELQSR